MYTKSVKICLLWESIDYVKMCQLCQHGINNYRATTPFWAQLNQTEEQFKTDTLKIKTAEYRITYSAVLNWSSSVLN